VTTPGAKPAQVPAARAESVKAIDPAIEFLGKLVGGTWRTSGSFVVEQRYEWRVPGKAIRSNGILGRGTPGESQSEALFGWDAAAKKVYYLDLHGHDTVYRGVVEAKDGRLIGDFGGMIGDTGTYRFEDKLVDDDTLAATMLAKNKAGEWVPIHTFTFKRFR
jgi:hypothetical protein